MTRSRLVVIAFFLAWALLLAGLPMAGAATGSDGVSYIVHPGDTLYQIALTHGVTVRELVSANRIPNPNRIYVGQMLHIPSASPAIVLTQPAPDARVSPPILVSGRANTFEGKVYIRVLDRYFRPVGTATALAAMGEYKPFQVEVSYSVPYSQWGYIDVYWVSPRDGSERDKVTVRVYLNKAAVTPTATPVPSPSPTPSATPGPVTAITYHVHPGDTLYRIAKGHDVSVSDIVRENGIRNPNLIFIGQTLKISSEHPGVLLTAPVTGQEVSSPITVTGRSDTFEGNVVVDILDYRFRRVGTATTMGGSFGSYAPFTATVSYSGISWPQWGYVEAYWRSPEDGSKLDAVTARVRLNPAEGAPSEARYHRVRWGETLYGIARRYGVTVRQIAEANGIRNIHRIYAGQRLVIP